MPAKGNKPLLLTHNGKTQAVAAWAQETGIPEQTIRVRITRLGWSVEKALTTLPNRKFGRSSGRPSKGAARSAPKLKRHATGTAWVRWMEGGTRRHKYFGPWGSVQARDGYARFLREWADGVTTAAPIPHDAGTKGTVAELVGRWLDHAKTRYRKFGRQTSEYHCHRAACGVLLDRFPAVRLAAFGVDHLEAVRMDMIARGWARKTVNNHTTRITAAFGWGVARKLVPAEVHYTLQRLEAIPPGTTTAAERKPVRSVPAADLAAVLKGKHLHPDDGRRAVLSAMIRVQVLTGLRPVELCSMRPEQVDRSGSEWKYTVAPEADKNFHRDRRRPPVWFGPRVQAILGPLIDAALAGGHTVFAFEPQRRLAQGPRPVSRTEYGRLIALACARAKVTPWHPHQLRHNRATDLKRIYESDAKAARGIGTSEDVAARIYVDPQESVDRRIARETG